MSMKDLKAEVQIKDIMSTPVLTVKEEEDITIGDLSSSAPSAATKVNAF